MSKLGTPLWGSIKQIFLVIFTFFSVLILMFPAAAYSQDSDEVVWAGFEFDVASDSWEEGKKSFDLQDGNYITPQYMSSHEGDFIRMSGFNQYGVMLEISGRNLFFSNDDRNDQRVDQKASRMPNGIPVHYGRSYVAAFGERTYTIRLVKGKFSLGTSSAEFIYHPGGIPVPEELLLEDAIEESPLPPESGEGLIQELTVIVIAPAPEKSAFYEADLIVEFYGPAHFRATYFQVHVAGSRRFAFHSVPEGTYTVIVAWGGKSITESVDIYGDSPNVQLTLD